MRVRWPRRRSTRCARPPAWPPITARRCAQSQSSRPSRSPSRAPPRAEPRAPWFESALAGRRPPARIGNRTATDCRSSTSPSAPLPPRSPRLSFSIRRRSPRSRSYRFARCSPRAAASTSGPWAIPANLQVEAWVPQAEVFPHTALLVCHGGSGTVLGGLAAGIPQVVLPIRADQPQNAQSVAAIGAGLALTKPDTGNSSARRCMRVHQR